MKLLNKTRYYHIYFSIIYRAKSRPVFSPSEVHHIIPKCMGGTDDSENLARLTLREHFICHKLLTKITAGDHQRKMEHAFSYMVLTQPGMRPTIRVTSHDYDLARMFSTKSRPKSWGKNISVALKGRVQNPETVAKMKATLTGRKLSNFHKDNIGKASALRRHSIDSIALMKETKAKTFQVLLPDGTVEKVFHLKAWAAERGLNYHTLHNNTNYENPIKWGSLKGYKVSTLTS